MNITHVALYTNNLEAEKNFFVQYFNGKAGAYYENDKGFASYFISFDSGARLEIMTHKELTETAPNDLASGFHHIAFSVGSEENVNALTRQIISDGFHLYSPCRKTGDGYYESCVADPDGNRIEITV